MGLGGPPEPIHRLLVLASHFGFVSRLHMAGVGEAELADGGLAFFGGDAGVVVVHCEDTLPQTPLSVEIYFQLFSEACRAVQYLCTRQHRPEGRPEGHHSLVMVSPLTALLHSMAVRRDSSRARSDTSCR